MEMYEKLLSLLSKTGKIRKMSGMFLEPAFKHCIMHPQLKQNVACSVYEWWGILRVSRNLSPEDPGSLQTCLFSCTTDFILTLYTFNMKHCLLLFIDLN